MGSMKRFVESVSIEMGLNGFISPEVLVESQRRLDLQTIKDFQVVRHGIEYPDYFQGCGVCFTPFDYVVTGIGDLEIEALQDAIEQMAINHRIDDKDFERIEKECTEISENQYSTLDYLADNLDDNVDIKTADSCWYYVSIRYSL